MQLTLTPFSPFLDNIATGIKSICFSKSKYRFHARDVITLENLKLSATLSGIGDGISIAIYNFAAQ